MSSLAGKTAVVTGASSGFGAATARLLAEAGVRVAGGARRVERLETEIALPLDVTDPESCAAFVVRAVHELGGIDILVNTAGLALGRVPADEATEEDERAMIETNVLGLMRITRLCLPHIRDGGHIVNLGSIAGRAGISERLRLRRLEVRRARLHLRAARGPARPPDPHHHGRPGRRRDRVLARPLQGRREHREVRLRGDRRRSPPTTSPSASSSRSPARCT